MMKYLLLICVLISGCTSTRARIGGKTEESIQKAEKAFAANQFDISYRLYKDAQEQGPKSIYYNYAKIGEAKSLEGMGQSSDSVRLLREVVLATDSETPDLAAQALYEMSYSYEHMGQDENAIAALLDARKRNTFLAFEVSQAQIPARLAAAYARLGREQESIMFLKEAESGISKILASKIPNVRNDWLAKIYLEMGMASSVNVSVENFEDILRSQNYVQSYLFRCIRLNSNQWSNQCLKSLQDVYRSCYNIVEQQKSETEQRIELAASFMDLISHAGLYRPLSSEVGNEYEKSFFSFLDELTKKTENIIYEPKAQTDLTAESQVLNGIKRGGQGYQQKNLHKKKKSHIKLPSVTETSEDPNI